MFHVSILVTIGYRPDRFNLIISICAGRSKIGIGRNFLDKIRIPPKDKPATRENSKINPAKRNPLRTKWAMLSRRVGVYSFHVTSLWYRMFFSKVSAVEAAGESRTKQTRGPRRWRKISLPGLACETAGSCWKLRSFLAANWGVA